MVLRNQSFCEIQEEKQIKREKQTPISQLPGKKLLSVIINLGAQKITWGMAAWIVSPGPIPRKPPISGRSLLFLKTE